MKPNDSSSVQKITLKCKPFTVLSAVQSRSSLNDSLTIRRSTRISTSSRANENDMTESQRRRCSSERKQKSQATVPCLSEDVDEDFVVRKKNSPRKRRSNIIQSSDDEDNVISPKIKRPKSNERKNRNNNDSDQDPIEPKRKTPIKRRKLRLTIKCNKITDYYAKVTMTNPLTNQDEVPEIPELRSNETPPPNVILLSSSEESDKEESVIVASQSPILLSPRQQNKPKCPDYKIVDGTNFAVDAFRFGEIADITSYFLTHFHRDHYVGLNKKFNRPIYMSSITGRLVKSILKVNPKLIRTMVVNTKYVVDGVEVTPIDANHCPGAVMFIFKLPCGRTILHTGDFRATPEMESSPIFWNNTISTIYLDTTYLHKSYNFCTQNDALLCLENEVKRFKDKNKGSKCLIVVGSYVIGKERVWCHIAQTFKMKVWLEAERRKAFDLIFSNENENQIIKDCVCDVREDAQLHVIPIQCINYAFLVDYLKNFKGHNLLALRPTGWSKNATPQCGNRISIVDVQYSEHSSYSELKRFVRFIQPEKVVSTVPISTSNTNTKSVPNHWLKATMPTTSQQMVTSYMKARKNSSRTDTLSDKHILLGGSSPLQLGRECASENSSIDTDYMP